MFAHTMNTFDAKDIVGVNLCILLVFYFEVLLRLVEYKCKFWLPLVKKLFFEEFHGL